MRIKKTIIVERSIDSSLLMERIKLYLKNQDYIITNSTKNSVFFKDNNWQIRSKGEIYKKVDNGKFEILESNENYLSRIKYTYYISFLPEFIITTIVIIIAFFQSFLILLFLLPLFVQLIGRVIALEERSRNLFSEITQ